MTQPRNRKHLIVSKAPIAGKFTPHPPTIKTTLPVPPDRLAHARRLSEELVGAVDEGRERREEVNIVVEGAIPGVYVQFEGLPGIPLKLEGLEDKKAKIALVAVNEVRQDGVEGAKPVQQATVFVPDGAITTFLNKFESYATEKTKKGEPKQSDLVDRMAGIRLATLRAFWTDEMSAYPKDDEIIWWEVWLRRRDGRELERLMVYSAQAGFEVGRRRLEFDERLVVLARASARQLSHAIDVLDDLAELRMAKETAAFFDHLKVVEQVDWVRDLHERLTMAPDDAPFVCLMDTGVTRGHLLLEDSLATDDMHACDPKWGTDDKSGHGTNMAGLALYGDLTRCLESSNRIELKHRLESVKILPPDDHSPNEPDLYGAIMGMACDRVESVDPYRTRCFAMATTTTDTRDRGQPTSWSAAIDALAAGRSFDVNSQGLVYMEDVGEIPHRLFILAGGNARPIDWPFDMDFTGANDAETIHDPGQAWNALTIGAYTQLTVLDPTDLTRKGGRPLARPGDLSPFSSTSVGFSDIWPVKPDVVFEGGNAVVMPGDVVDFPIPSMSLLTTHHEPFKRSLDLMWATSAATAQASWLAGMIAAEYPQFWPETVRGLIVHSARWTPKMQQHVHGAAGKRLRAKLVRRYGYGVPSLERALRSANNDAVLVAQGVIKPYQKGAINEWHIHDLPWPLQALRELQDTPVRLRVTLSYFVEPNPARRGWKRRYSYASHNLRFDVKGATETAQQFKQRLNKAALAPVESRPGPVADSTEWYLGPDARNKGSLHSDVWEGTAAALADRGVIAVYPIGGWWKESQKRDRSESGVRYSLIVSIETDDLKADIWTPIALQIGVPVEVLDI